VLEHRASSETNIQTFRTNNPPHPFSGSNSAKMDMQREIQFAGVLDTMFLMILTWAGPDLTPTDWMWRWYTLLLYRTSCLLIALVQIH